MGYHLRFLSPLSLLVPSVPPAGNLPVAGFLPQLARRVCAPAWWKPCALPGGRGQLPSQSRAAILAEWRPQTPHPPRRAHGGRRPYHHQGAPQSLLCGERRSSGMSETRRLRQGERYAACDDEVVSKCALREYVVRHKSFNRPSRMRFSASNSILAIQGTTLSRIAPS